MKIAKIFLLSGILIILINITAFSQPTATVQFYAGYSIPLGDLKGTFGPTFNTWTGGNPDTNTYYMKSGINYGLYIKLPVKRKSPIHITGGVGFNAFSNSVLYDDSSGTADISLSQSYLGIALGSEYNFATKKSKINPFVGAEFMVNIIGGKLTIVYPAETKTYTMNSTLRLGVQLGAGVDFVVHNNIGVVFGAKYTIANLIGKSFKEDIGLTYNLGDKSHELNGSSYPDKNIQYLQLYGGMSFYFGR